MNGLPSKHKECLPEQPCNGYRKRGTEKGWNLFIVVA
jgi:hypothetical protein